MDFENDPDDHFIDGDNYRALFNVDGEVMIGESIYKMTEEGYYQIVDGDMEILHSFDDISNGRTTFPKNVIFVGNEIDANGRVLASTCSST